MGRAAGQSGFGRRRPRPYRWHGPPRARAGSPRRHRLEASAWPRTPAEYAAPVTGWPGGADVAVALTFDVDAESAWLGEGPEYARRLTTLSQAGFGPRRGLGRTWKCCEPRRSRPRSMSPATPPITIPASCRRSSTGHEVAHHGYLHLRTDDLTAEQQRAEIEQGSTSFPGCHVTVQLGRRWR